MTNASKTLNALLVEMVWSIVRSERDRDGCLQSAGDARSGSVRRPGRFDRHVLVDRPDIKGREAILKVHAARIKMDDKVELQWIAKLTPGFVGADLANLVNEAAPPCGRTRQQVLRDNGGVRGRNSNASWLVWKNRRGSSTKRKSSVSPITNADTPWSPAACPTPIPSTRFRSSRVAWAPMRLHVTKPARG